MNCVGIIFFDIYGKNVVSLQKFYFENYENESFFFFVNSVVFDGAPICFGANSNHDNYRRLVKLVRYISV